MLVLSGLAGCAEPGLQRGFSGRDAELARTGAPDDFSIVSAGHRRAVVSALGHQVAVVPAEGFCLAREAIETSDRSAFLLFGDCAIETPAASGPSGAAERLELPPGVPGIITVSISGDPGFSRPGGAAGLADLQAYVESPEGRALLGRGGDGDQISVADSRRIGDALYVLVEDADGGVPVLAPRFWRAFVELNERLTVVTISGFRDRPLPEEEMLRHLGDQVRQLQVANSEPVNEVPVRVPVAEMARQPRGTGAPSLAARTEEEAVGDEGAGRRAVVGDLTPTSIIAADEGGGQVFRPVPERRGAPRARQGAAPAQGGPAAGENEEDLALPPPRADGPADASGAGAATASVRKPPRQP
jgi:hypothetical protein